MNRLQSSRPPLVDSQTFGVPRRKFLFFGALGGLGAAACIGVPKVRAEDGSDLVFSHGPEDALVDFIGEMSGLESQILGTYYIILAKISKQLAENYERLRKAASELKRLVPALSTGEVTKVRDISEYGKTVAALIGQLAVAESSVTISNHSDVIRSMLSDLQNTTGSSRFPSDSITLSEEAVAKLKYILDLIENLQKPTEDLSKLSLSLTNVSNKIQNTTSQIRPLIVESVELLIAANYIANPSSEDVLKTLIRRMTAAKKPTSVSALREKAVQNNEKVSDLIKSLASVQVPTELIAYANSQSPSIRRNYGVPREILIASLAGINKWITNYDRVKETVISSFGDNVRFVSVADRSEPAAPWGRRIKARIKDILVELIPEANDDRVAWLFLKKIWMNFWQYSVADQKEIFYAYLPELPELSNYDLFADDDRRHLAAKKLAQII